MRRCSHVSARGTASRGRPRSSMSVPGGCSMPWPVAAPSRRADGSRRAVRSGIPSPVAALGHSKRDLLPHDPLPCGRGRYFVRCLPQRSRRGRANRHCQLMAGGVVGFLFGIPRYAASSTERLAAEQADAKVAKYRQHESRADLGLADEDSRWRWLDTVRRDRSSSVLANRRGWTYADRRVGWRAS